MSALVVLADRLLRIAAVALLLGLLASVMTGVVSRQIGRPVPWSDEMAQYLLVWTGIIGWMIAARRGNHIRINVFIDLLPRGLRLLVEIAIQLARDSVRRPADPLGLAADRPQLGYRLGQPAAAGRAALRAGPDRRGGADRAGRGRDSRRHQGPPSG